MPLCISNVKQAPAPTENALMNRLKQASLLELVDRVVVRLELLIETI